MDFLSLVVHWLLSNTVVNTLKLAVGPGSEIDVTGFIFHNMTTVKIHDVYFVVNAELEMKTVQKVDTLSQLKLPFFITFWT